MKMLIQNRINNDLDWSIKKHLSQLSVIVDFVVFYDV